MEPRSILRADPLDPLFEYRNKFYGASAIVFGAVILKLPEWKPGMQHNRNVAVYFNLPVNFGVEE
jgi:hypothetical protein